MPLATAAASSLLSPLGCRLCRKERRPAVNFNASTAKWDRISSRRVNPNTSFTRGVACRAGNSSESEGTENSAPSTNKVQLPVFPLGVVALPTASVPLHIFEARYRVLFATLLDGDSGVNQDLVDPLSPWKGSRTFGMCWVNGQGGMATTGTTLHIDDHKTLPDGRMLIENTGQRRFRVLKVVQERPVMVCEVEYLEDEKEDGRGDDELESLGQEVLDVLKNVLNLNFKLKGMDVRELEGKIDFSEKEKLSPREISFWVASMFTDAEQEQQFLLEMDSTQLRLERERNLLSEAQRYLSAQSALQSVFASSGSDPDDGAGSSRAP